MSLPQMPPVLAEHIPLLLRRIDQWVCWQFEEVGGRVTKVPYVAGSTLGRASSTDPGTWRSFEAALEHHRSNPSRGVGFVVTEAAGIVGIDLDHCVANGMIEAEALSIIHRIGSYAEISPSGTGVRIFARGRLPATGRKKANVEMYDSKRYLTVTGNKIELSHTHIVDASTEIVNLHTETFGLEVEPGAPEKHIERVYSDQEIIVRMFGSRNGHNYEALYSGHWEGLYPSQSEADMALMNVLAYWADGDEGAMIRLFLQSGLGDRAKAKRDDYLERTAREAIAKLRPRSYQGSKKIDSATDRSSSQEKLSEGDPERIQPGSFDGIGLQLTSMGGIKENYANYYAILSQHPHWRNRLFFDEFIGEACLDSATISEPLLAQVMNWFCSVLGFGGNHIMYLKRAVADVAYLSASDPLQDFVARLPQWDGNSRLGSWLVTYASAQPDPYSAWVGYAIIMQMISRAIHPGCIGRYMAIFEGPENAGKSTLIRALGAPWSTVFAPSMDSKEAHMAIQGAWVAEIDELDAFRKAAQTRIKSFISQTSDDYVPKFSNHVVKRPRRTVFIGTTNDNNYLTGTSGNTRFLPIKVGTIDVEGFVGARDQIFAEALHLLTDNPKIDWWSVPDHLDDRVVAERTQRLADNVFADELSTWLDGASSPTGIYRNTVTWQEIFEDFMGLEDKSRRSQRQLQMDITDALKRLGWTKKRTKRGNLWARP